MTHPPVAPITPPSPRKLFVYCENGELVIDWIDVFTLCVGLRPPVLCIAVGRYGGLLLKRGESCRF